MKHFLFFLVGNVADGKGHKTIIVMTTCDICYIMWWPLVVDGEMKKLLNGTYGCWDLFKCFFSTLLKGRYCFWSNFFLLLACSQTALTWENLNNGSLDCHINFTVICDFLKNYSTIFEFSWKWVYYVVFTWLSLQ